MHDSWNYVHPKILKRDKYRNFVYFNPFYNVNFLSFSNVYIISLLFYMWNLLWKRKHLSNDIVQDIVKKQSLIGKVKVNYTWNLLFCRCQCLLVLLYASTSASLTTLLKVVSCICENQNNLLLELKKNHISSLNFFQYTRTQHTFKLKI